MKCSAEYLRKLFVNTIKEFREHLCTPPAIEILLMTCAHESLFGEHMKQIGGPALGLFGIEPATHDSIFANYFNKRYPEFKQKEHAVLGQESIDALKYQIIVARGIYADKVEPLPSENDIQGMAAYYKKHWNTMQGAAKIPDVINNYMRFVKNSLEK